VNIYRVVAMVVLYGMLIGIGAYAATMGFYAVNTSWVAPVTISPSNEKILAMTQQVVSTRQQLDSIDLQTRSLTLSLTEMVARRASLQNLAGQLSAAIADERSASKSIGRDLEGLADKKKMDIVYTQTLLGNVDRERLDIEHNLKVGLITRSEAMEQQQALAQFQNSLTDSQIGAVVLRDNVRQKLGADLSVVDSLTKKVELQSEIQQLDVQIATTRAHILNNRRETGKIESALKLSLDSPYLVASEAAQAVDFAFVPFDNQTSAVVGAPVYGCALGFVGCKQVGTVGRVFSEEEKAENPIFRSTTRGILVQLSLTNKEAAKSKTLFVGNHAPLGI